jgi:hypothetical protein
MPYPAPEPVAPFEPDPVIDAYKADIDRTLLRDNLRLTPTERVMRLHQAVRTIRALQQARQQARQQVSAPHG